MKIRDLFLNKKTLISFEFFPPKTDQGHQSLLETISSLKELNPSFVSMTYGAGGSTRQKTAELVSLIKNKIGIEAMAHLTCVGHSKSELESILSDFKNAGIENILALRGDPPKGETKFVQTKDGFLHASDLVKFIKERFPFSVGVAGYPEKHVESKNFEDDFKNLQIKVNQGADFIITQLFFNNDDFFNIKKLLANSNVNIPLVAGIMPVTDFEQLQKFTAMCGAKIPQSLFERLEKVKDDKQKVIQVGIDYASEQCEDLIRRGVAGIHFYTLNRSQSTREIFLRLKALDLFR